MPNRYQGPMQVKGDSPRPWLQDQYPANSAARNQDLSKGVIFQRPANDEEETDAET